MFPISSNQPLSFEKVADYWTREISFPVTSEEALHELTKAWWRGELVANGAKRCDVLRAIFCALRSDFLAFGYPESPDPSMNELPNRTVEVRFVVPLPNSQLKTWDDNNCLAAYRAVADVWEKWPHVFELSFPVMRALKLSEEEFTKWLIARKWPRPTFWAVSEALSKSSPPPKSLSEGQMMTLAQEYSDFARAAGQRPTQLGFDEYLKGREVRGNREKLRKAFIALNGRGSRGRPARQK